MKLPTCRFPRLRVGLYCRFPSHRISLYCGFIRASSLPTSRILQDSKSACIANSNGQFGNIQSQVSETLLTLPKLPTDGVPALSTSLDNFREWKARLLTHTASEGLTHLLLDGQVVLTQGIPVKPIKDATTNQMVIPPENKLTRLMERNAVIVQNNGLV
jgi:hypothetical protein